MIVALGNHSAATTAPGNEGTKIVQALPKGKRATYINFPDEWNLAQCLRALTDGDGIMNNHFASGSKPAWVASDNSAMANLISDNYNGIEVRDLELDSDGSNES